MRPVRLRWFRWIAPGVAGVVVFDYYPTENKLLTWLGRFLRLDAGIGHRANWIDAGSGAVIRFNAGEGLAERTVLSPCGRLVVRSSSGVTVWELPPGRSWVPLAVVTVLLTFVGGAWTVVKRRLRRPLESDSRAGSPSGVKPG